MSPSNDLVAVLANSILNATIDGMKYLVQARRRNKDIILRCSEDTYKTQASLIKESQR